MATKIGRRIKVGMATAISVSALLGGCADGVEMNGKLLDAVGLSTASLSQNKSEPRIAPRAPLVMPPSDKRLPEPGSAPPPPIETADASWPKDKDQERVASAKDKIRQQDQYCKDGTWKERAIDNDASQQGPLGSCGSIFSWTQNLFSGGQSDQQPTAGP